MALVPVKYLHIMCVSSPLRCHFLLPPWPVLMTIPVAILYKHNTTVIVKHVYVCSEPPFVLIDIYIIIYVHIYNQPVKECFV